jgi:kinesin family protein 2/24
MERFYLENLEKYHLLVNALDPTPKPRVSTGEAGPDMVVSARIRPLSKAEGFPCAIYPRATRENVVDIHDLYNHPSGIPILKVRSLAPMNNARSLLSLETCSPLTTR